MTTIYAIALAVGDRVAYVRHHHWGGRPLEHGFGTVTKINRHGHITVTPEPRADGTPREPKVFDKYGKERGKEYGYTHLVAPATLEAELAGHDAREARNRAVDALAAEIAGMKTHRGYYVTTEGKARLAELVAAIPVLE